MRNSPTIDNPLADRNLPHGIGIDQQPVSREEKQRVDPDPDRGTSPRIGLAFSLAWATDRARARPISRYFRPDRSTPGIILGKSAPE